MDLMSSIAAELDEAVAAPVARVSENEQEAAAVRQICLEYVKSRDALAAARRAYESALHAYETAQRVARQNYDTLRAQLRNDDDQTAEKEKSATAEPAAMQTVVPETTLQITERARIARRWTPQEEEALLRWVKSKVAAVGLPSEAVDVGLEHTFARSATAVLNRTSDACLGKYKDLRRQGLTR